MPIQLKVSDFADLACSGSYVLLDMRSESEYNFSSIPGSLNIPILNDAHRHEVGLTYKQKGKKEAIRKGFELAGPLFSSILDKADKLCGQKPVLLYCWRGGLRSSISSWLLETAGFNVSLLEGGYKAFRNFALSQFSVKRKILVLGGRTGSGKTELLKRMKNQGQFVIDLENIANHRGSAFGALGKGPQPSNEYFENMLAMELLRIPVNEPVWIENESRAIGKLKLPDDLYRQIRFAPLVELNIDIVRRKQNIMKEYGIFPVEELLTCTEKLAKRLGGLRLQNALSALAENDLDAWLDIVLG